MFWNIHVHATKEAKYFRCNSWSSGTKWFFPEREFCMGLPCWIVNMPCQPTCRPIQNCYNFGNIEIFEWLQPLYFARIMTTVPPAHMVTSTHESRIVDNEFNQNNSDSFDSLLTSNKSGQNTIDSNFLKLCCSAEVHSLNRVVDWNYRQCGSNAICRTTFELKTDSNVELDWHVRYSNFIRTIA